MPTPKPGEKREQFVSRCIPIVMGEGTAKDEKQAAAICFSMFKKGLDIKSMEDMGAEQYARQEAWDVSSAAQAIQQVATLMQNEVDEPDDLRQLSGIISQLCLFINGEVQEMLKAAAEAAKQEAEEAAGAGETAEPPLAMPEVPATLKSRIEVRDRRLDTSYVKALGVLVPDSELAVKFVGRDQIKHYVFIWGSPSKLDIEKDFFTRPGAQRGTDFWDNHFGKMARPLTWDHGQDKLFKDPSPVVGKSVEWGDDELGRWAVSVLDKDRRYRKYLDQFIEQKALGVSSDSAPQYVVREQQGKGNWIKQWPWIASALTPVPAEPRMKDFAPEFLKSYGIVLPEVDASARQATLRLRREALQLRTRSR